MAQGGVAGAGAEAVAPLPLRLAQEGAQDQSQYVPPSSGTVRPLTRPGEGSADGVSVDQSPTATKPGQQGQLELRELKEQLAATASAAAAEAAAHKAAYEEQMELAKQFRAKAEADAAAAALYLQEALDGKAAATIQSIRSKYSRMGDAK